MNSKIHFVENLKKRIKIWVVRVIKFCRTLPADTSTRVINYQLIKSATSVGANHRAASKGRSDREFYAKMCIVVEESDESEYWLELIQELGIECDQTELGWLLSESQELTKILGKAKDTIRRKLHPKK